MLGILAVVPVAVGLGIAALVQIGRRGEAGKGLAVGGLVASGAWTVIIGGIVAIAVSTGGLYADLGRVAQAGSTEVGTCLVEGDDGGRWPVGECSRTHDAEVYLVSELDLVGYPGDLEVLADEICSGGFTAYTGEGYFASDYDYGFFLPDEAEWADGERRVVCVIRPLAFERLEGSARS